MGSVLVSLFSLGSWQQVLLTLVWSSHHLPACLVRLVACFVAMLPISGTLPSGQLPGLWITLLSAIDCPTPSLCSEL